MSSNRSLLSKDTVKSNEGEQDCKRRKNNEKQRNYQKRKKVIETPEQAESRKKFNAERQKEYRDRKKKASRQVSRKMSINQEELPSNEICLAECRTCLQALDANSVLVDLFQSWEPPWDGMESTIAEDLAKLANVQITQTDRYSKVICEPCCLKLQSACDFACSVRKNDRFLRQKFPPVPEEMDFYNETVWPKPIQLDKNINRTVYKRALDVEIKQEAVSDDEYTNIIGMEDSREELSTLEIKIEPEELIQPVGAPPEDDESIILPMEIPSRFEIHSYSLNGHEFHDSNEEIERLTNGIDSKEEITSDKIKMQKFKRKYISLEEKIEILDRIKSGEKPSSIAKTLNLNESTIRTIVRNEKEIRKNVAAGCSQGAKRVGRKRDINIVKMEHALLKWMEECLDKKIPLSTNIIRQKAIGLYTQLKKSEFSSGDQPNLTFVASTGWFEKFKKRCSLRSLKFQGVQTSADAEAAQLTLTYERTLRKIKSTMS